MFERIRGLRSFLPSCPSYLIRISGSAKRSPATSHLRRPKLMGK
ncbi:hypothetical protein Celaphus_00014874 [Cervus elaphus hippelaphus]|uniref:Uncharacterized protein n=1 Tax=Cervus elaphus hippelaphus TaxID=46360 RepID=A0A212D3V0_CEREH|nr:hypothetical protein Celaphus_00014874 [Cervus elaphus hippelaphus]